MTTPSAQPNPSEPALPLPTRPPRLTRSPGGAVPSGRVTVTGTVSMGVEANCVLLDGYLLVNGPRELFQSGAQVRVTGRVQPNLMTTCQQGIPLVVETAERA